MNGYECSNNFKGIDTRGADPQVVTLAAAESENARRTADLCDKIATSIITHPDQADTLAAGLPDLKQANTEIRNQYDILRIVLARKYGVKFPTLAETASQPDDSIDGQDYRTWTSKNGKFRIKAKLLGVENGIVKLKKKSDGKVIEVPIEKLGDKDQQFIEKALQPRQPPK